MASPLLLSLLKRGAQIVREGTVRLDGWANANTGLGIRGRDKTTGAYFKHRAPLAPSETLPLWEQNDLAYIAASELPEDAMRQGFCVEREHDGEEDGEDTADAELEERAIEAELKALGVGPSVTEARILARACGGGCLILGVEGAGSWSEPLVEGVGKLAFVLVADRTELSIDSWDDLGRPAFYRYSPHGVMPGTQIPLAEPIHASRILRFNGARTTNRTRRNNLGWDLSVYDRCLDALRDMGIQYSTATAMFQDMSLIVIKMRGMIEALAADDDQTVETRLALNDVHRSAHRALYLDAGTQDAPSEDVKVVERAGMTAVPGILNSAALRFAAALRMPLSKLLGQAPAGLNATGEGDRDVWNRQIEAERTLELQPVLERLVRIVAAGLGYGANTYTIEWPELVEATEAERSDVELKRSQVITGLADKGVIQPEEGALALAEAVPWLKVDREARQTFLEENLPDLLDQQLTPPEPVQVNGAPTAQKPKAPKAPVKG